MRIYTSADGFGSSAAFNLVRDSRGFIWVCSRDGLVRFDGSRFITYRIGNDDADPSVFNLTPTRNGAYWIDLNRGTDYRFLPQDESAQLAPIRQLAEKNDSRIPLTVEPLSDSLLPNFEDEDGNLWASDNKGIYLMRDVDTHMAPEMVDLGFPQNSTADLTDVAFRNARGGGLWIGSNRGLVRRLPNGKTIHFPLTIEGTDRGVRAFAEDKEGRIWVAHLEGLAVLMVPEVSRLAELANYSTSRVTLKKGVVDMAGQPVLPDKVGKGASFSFADIFRRNSGKSLGADKKTTPIFYAILSASDGKIWLTSTHGLIVFDGQKFQQYTSRQGFAADLLTSIVEDNDGYIWIVSHGGLHRVNPFGLTAFDQTDGIAQDRVHSIYEDGKGELQIVSGNFNVSGLRGDSFITAQIRIPEDETTSWMSSVAFLDSHGDWWVNTHRNLYRYTGINRIEDLRTATPTAVYNDTNGLFANNVLRVLEDSKGDIWFSPRTGDRMGLTRWQRTTREFQHFFENDGLPANPAASGLVEDNAGNLWFSFSEGGIVRYRDGSFKLVDVAGIPTGGITKLYRDKMGRIWIATSREGLFRIDVPESEQPVVRRYSINDGLTSNNIRCITEDLYGNIYIGTVRGVNRLSPETGRVKYYGTSDGLSADFINAIYRDRQGAIWFGTFNGVSKLVPVPDAQMPAPVVLISGLRIAGEDYWVSPLGQHEVSVPDQSADRNNLQIDFLSVSTGGSAPTRYQYKLEGVGTGWSEPATEGAVTFANLSPGAYHFLVQAINGDDVVSPQPAIVSFTVLPPVWQRWWFLLLLTLTVGGLIYFVYAYRMRKLLEMERVRTRIATDLHDDIGSSLSQIAILSEVVRQTANDETINHPLNLIADTSREMVDSMSDIVWAINPDKDHLSDLVQRMRRFASDILDARHIEYRFKLDETHRELHLSTDLRREVYLMFKECVNNLVKHAEATEAEISVEVEGKILNVQIIDNGRVLSPQRPSTQPTALGETVLGTSLAVLND